MKMQYDGYNQKINQIYVNPYSNSFSTTKTNVTSTHSLDVQGDHNGLSVNSPRRVSYVSGGNIHYEDSTCRLGEQSMKKSMRLSASQIVCKNYEQDNITISKKQESKPTINYFVTEFERLQAENKELKSKLQPSKQNSTISETKSDLNNDKLINENKNLRKMLEEEQKLNIKKNEQIGQLLQKINQIQNQVNIITNSKNIAAREQEERQRSRQQFLNRKVSELEEKSALLEQTAIKFEQNQMQLRQKQIQLKRILANLQQKEIQLEQFRQKLQQQHIQLVQNKKITQIQRQNFQQQKQQFQQNCAHLQQDKHNFDHFHRSIQQEKFKLEQTCSQLQQHCRNLEYHNNQLMQQIGRKQELFGCQYRQLENRHSVEKQQQHRQFYQQLSILKQAYSQTITTQTTNLNNRITQLQHQLQQTTQKYQTLSQQLNNIRYTPISR